MLTIFWLSIDIFRNTIKTTFLRQAQLKKACGIIGDMKKHDVTRFAQNTQELNTQELKNLIVREVGLACQSNKTYEIICWLVVQTANIDAEDINLSEKQQGDGGMVVLGKDLHICAVLVQQQSGAGVVRVTGQGNLEQVKTGPNESAGYSLVVVADDEKVTILKHSKYWLFCKRE
jgi:hypothetical protein